MKRSAWLVPVFALVLAGGAACSNDTAGSPLPSPAKTDGTTTTRSTEPSGTETGGSGGSLTSLDPCDLVSSSAVEALGITGSPKDEEIGKVRSCSWRVDKSSIADSYTITVALFEQLGLKDVAADGEVKELKVGSHDAGQSYRRGGGGCAVSLAVTESSRVDVQVAGGDKEKLCAPALDAAKLVEPELP